MSLTEQIYKGQYEYFRNGNTYAQENFSVYKADQPANFIYSSEILSRVSTGEFLKIYVDYEVTPLFDPINIKIRKSLGEQSSKETYNVNYQNKNVLYSFVNSEGEKQTYEKVINGKFQITTPSFLTSLLITQNKKVDNIGRTQYLVINSNNEWKYENPFEEKFFYLETRSNDNKELTIGINKLVSSVYYLYEKDVGQDKNEQPIVYYQSRNIGIPYKAILNDGLEIRIKQLKVTETNYKGMF
jgi:hypothetical protein